MKPDDKNHSIAILTKRDRAPAGMVEANTLFNPALYLKASGQNGGQVSLSKFEELFIDSQLLERFLEMSMEAIPQKNGCRPKTVRVRLAVEDAAHGDMQRLHDQIMSMSEGPISHTNALAFFTFSMIKRMLRLDSMEDLQRLIEALDFYSPSTYEETLEVMKQIIRR